ncbi:hypothetical protein [Haloarcula onubensis]|uniref:Uncharacterized protein n=1 Tax=Haloarcula onubensis TaxID=2950539 RepID=A0ABU2FKT1_9EURY|nr:hypothetical protein [Halomicroarcula sp. S3CR25-11]MDS0280806.1 hypothetical protein [Halomicroarcula sp. S3CR25-11]
MCHHRGEIPEWTTEQTEPTDEEAEELPEFLNEDGEEVSVLTDGGE